jgi:hypothetical protein
MLSDCDTDDGVEGQVQGATGAERSNVPIDPNSVKHVYRDETWTQFTNEYAPGTLPFTGDPPGVKKSYPRMPSFLHLFGLFWTRNMLRSICIETNRYARVVEDGRSKGGHDWYDMDEKELRTFLAVSLYIWHEKTTEREKLLGQVREVVLLPGNCESTFTKAFPSIAKMFAPHKHK